MEELDIECDANFSPPHLSRRQLQTYHKDTRGVYFTHLSQLHEGDSKLDVRGSSILVDTAENFAQWQIVRENVSGIGEQTFFLLNFNLGSAVLASILRESKYAFGDKELFCHFQNLTRDLLHNSPDVRKGLYLASVASLKQV